MKTIRLIWFGIWMYANLIQFIPTVSNIRKFRKSGDVEKEIEAIRKFQNGWGKSIIKMAKIKVNVYGEENLPNGAALYVSNHQSYTDIPLFVAITNRQAGFLAKAELKKLPFFGDLITDVRSVYIERGDARASLRAIDEGAKLLKKGYGLGVFPEGTRSKGPVPLEFKKGALRPAFKAEVPIIPITISGSYKAIEEKGWPTSTTIDFYIHTPIETKGIKKDQQNQIADEVERIIKKSL